MYPVNYKPSVSARLQFTQLIISPAVIISLTPYTLPYISPDPHLSSSMLWCFCMCAHAGNLWLYQAHALRCLLVCMCVWKGGDRGKLAQTQTLRAPELLSSHSDRAILHNRSERRGAQGLQRAPINHRAHAAGKAKPPHLSGEAMRKRCCHW